MHLAKTIVLINGKGINKIFNYYYYYYYLLSNIILL